MCCRVLMDYTNTHTVVAYIIHTHTTVANIYMHTHIKF